MFPCTQTEEEHHVCTICGEHIALKVAFNAHIRAHLKEKLNTKMERRSEQVRQTAIATSSPPVTPTVKRKLSSPVPTLAPTPHTRIKLELPPVVAESVLPTMVHLQVLEPSLPSPSLLPPSLPPSVSFPSPPVSDPDTSRLSSEFSHEMEMNRVDLNNDLSIILDQIEKDFEGPSLELQDLPPGHMDPVLDPVSEPGLETPLESVLETSLETPPESDTEPDLGFIVTNTSQTGNTIVLPRVTGTEASLVHTAADHDYLVKSIKQSMSPVSPALPSSPASSPLSLAKFACLPPRAIAVLNQLPGKLVLQKSGSDSRLVNVFKVEKVGSGTSTASTLINIECVQDGHRRKRMGQEGNMTNAKIIETTKGSDGEKEYKIVLGVDRDISNCKLSSGKSKQSAECNICGKSITTKNMARHMEKHTGKKKFQCEICQASFFQKTHLKNHIVLHENGYYECRECQQKFLRKTDLQKHQKTVHCTDSSLSCPVCGAHFLDASKLDVHRKTHVSERKELCGLCGEKFEDKEAMMSHMEEHTSAITDRPFSCDVCSKTFAQKGHLNRHIKCHGGESDLSCSVCNKQCRNKMELVRHQSAHLACHMCAAVFESKTLLQEHILISHPPAIDLPSSFLSPCSLSSPEDEYFDDDSNSCCSPMDSSPLDMFQSSFSVSPRSSHSDTGSGTGEPLHTLGSFLSDIDTESPLMSEPFGEQKPFADSYLSQQLTLDDISDSSFFDISHQLDEELYSADLFAS